MSGRAPHEQESRRGSLGLRISAVAILAFSVVVLVQAFLIGREGGFGPEGSGFFPVIITAGLVFFAALFVLQTTARPDRALQEHVAEEEEATNWRTVGLIVVALLAYAFLLAPLGYVVATTLFFSAACWILDSRRWVRDLVIGLASSVLIYVGFAQFLGVRLPAGLLEVIF